MTHRPAASRGPARAQQRRRYPLWRLIRANLYDLWQLLNESRLVLASFGLVTLISTIYLGFFYPGTPESPRPRGLPEALYETLKLLTLQSGLAFPGDLPGQVIFFLTPLLGLALIFQSVLNFGRLVLDKGSRREAWQISLASTYRDHVIVCGLGRLGLRIANQLIAAGYEPVVVEKDWQSEFVQRTLADKVPVVLGDAREALTLRRAGVQRARALVAAINDDLLNIEIALTARALRPDLRAILRVFGEELDHNLERNLGPNTAFSASALAAPTFAAAAVSGEVDYVLPVADTLLGVTQLTVQPGSQLSGFARALEEAAEVRLLHYRTADGRRVPPGPMRQLGGGDQVTLIGSLAENEALRARNIRDSKYGFLAPSQPQRPTAELNTIIICGLGKVGYRVVRQLHRLNPRPRIVVVRLPDGRPEFLRKISELEGVTIEIGDGRDLEVLLRAGLDRAYSVAALTADDLLNLQIGLAARSHRPDVHIVLRTFSDALAEKLADLVGIRTTYSTSALAAPTLAAAAVLGDIRHAFYVAEQLYSSQRIAVGERHPFAGQSVAEIRERFGALVIGLRREGVGAAIPSLDAQLGAGDEVTVLAPLEVLGRLRALRAAPEAAPSRARPAK
jgi:Trk K+ transport system NAD-binding subunit